MQQEILTEDVHNYIPTRYHIVGGWYGLLDGEEDSHHPLNLNRKWLYREKELMKKIGQKYEPEMFDKYWNHHYDTHYESGKNKCARFAPYVKFYVMEEIPCTDPKNVDLKIRGVIWNTERRRTCFVSMGKITITVPLTL